MGDRGISGTRHAARPLALALAALALLAGGCGGADSSSSTAAHARLMRAGARVFAEHCQSCHPLLGRPNEKIQVDSLPLDLDQVRPSRATVLRRLEQGGVSMGSLATTLDGGEVRAVTAYVLAVGGRDVQPLPGGAGARQLAQGRALYAEHCQRCHQLAGRPPTRPNPIWEGTDFDAVQPSILYVEQKVREGQREAMPSFRDRLSWEQVRAVAVYVNATARGGSSRAAAGD